MYDADISSSYRLFLVLSLENIIARIFILIRLGGNPHDLADLMTYLQTTVTAYIMSNVLYVGDYLIYNLYYLVFCL